MTDRVKISARSPSIFFPSLHLLFFRLFHKVARKMALAVEEGFTTIIISLKTESSITSGGNKKIKKPVE